MSSKFYRVFIFIFFLPPLSWSLSARSESLSAVQYYNQGVQRYNSQQKIQAAADFRKALLLDPWLWAAKKNLDRLNYSPPFHILIPSELFLALIAFSLTGLLFSLSAVRILLFGFCLILHFSFSFYRSRPRLTILEKTAAHTAPHSSSPVLFSAAAGAWVLQLKTSKEWIQIKTPEQAVGWISKIKLQQK